MAFSFGQYGGAQQEVTQLAEENSQNSGGLLPPQKNNMFLIEKVEIKEAASGAVQVNFQFNCIGEKYANRKVFNSINVVKTSGELNKIGETQIGAIAHAVGFQGVLDNPEDLMQYANVPFVADVKIEKGNAGYEDRNVLANWKIANGQPFSELPMPKAPQQAAPAFKANQQAPQQAAGGWANAQQPQQNTTQQAAPQQQSAPQQAAPQFNNSGPVPSFLQQKQ